MHTFVQVIKSFAYWIWLYIKSKMQVHVLKQSKFCIHTCICTQIPPNKHFTKTFLSEKNPNSKLHTLCRVPEGYSYRKLTWGCSNNGGLSSIFSGSVTDSPYPTFPSFSDFSFLFILCRSFNNSRKTRCFRWYHRPV